MSSKVFITLSPQESSPKSRLPKIGFVSHNRPQARQILTTEARRAQSIISNSFFQLHLHSSPCSPCLLPSVGKLALFAIPGPPVLRRPSRRAGHARRLPVPPNWLCFSQRPPFSGPEASNWVRLARAPVTIGFVFCFLCVWSISILSLFRVSSFVLRISRLRAASAVRDRARLALFFLSPPIFGPKSRKLGSFVILGSPDHRASKPASRSRVAAASPSLPMAKLPTHVARTGRDCRLASFFTSNLIFRPETRQIGFV